MSSTGRAVLRFCSLMTPLTAAVVTLALLAALLSAALSGAALPSAPASAQVPDIATVAVDLDPTGNTATNIGAGGAGIDAGDIQSTLNNVAIGSTVTFDIVVDSVPSPGIFGVGVEVNYNQAIVEVTAVNRFFGLLQYSSDPVHHFGLNDPLPDTDGSFRVDAVDLSTNDETGPGKVLEVTVKCIALGTTPLTLTDSFTLGGANAGILKSDAPYSVGTELEAFIGCGVAVPFPTPTPTPPPTPTPIPTPGPPTPIPTPVPTPCPTNCPSIAIVAVDLDQTGNTATNIGTGGAGIDPGDIQSTLGDVAIGSTVSFDIVVDSVTSPGIWGLGLEVNYSNWIVRVTAVDRDVGGLGRLLQYSSGTPNPSGGNDPPPDTDGSFRVDAVDLTGSLETGPGKVLAVTVECIAAGTTPITLTDGITGGGANAGILHKTAAFIIATELEAFIGCGVPVDSDGDGVQDSLDACPNEAGPLIDGCLPVGGVVELAVGSGDAPAERQAGGAPVREVAAIAVALAAVGVAGVSWHRFRRRVG